MRHRTPVPSESIARPPPAEPPVIFIDGIAREYATSTYPDISTAFATPPVIELRAGDLLIRTFAPHEYPSPCDDNPGIRRYFLGVCALASGDLRYAYTESEGLSACWADAFCPTHCWGCPGERCTSRATSIDPFFSHLACAPIGPRAQGETCAWIADAAGAYDDCGAGLLCIDGTCRPTCEGPDCAPGCVPVPGHAPEILVCP